MSDADFHSSHSKKTKIANSCLSVVSHYTLVGTVLSHPAFSSKRRSRDDLRSRVRKFIVLVAVVPLA